MSETKVRVISVYTDHTVLRMPLLSVTAKVLPPLIPSPATSISYPTPLAHKKEGKGREERLAVRSQKKRQALQNAVFHVEGLFPKGQLSFPEGKLRVR